MVVLDSVTHIWEACKLAYAGHLTRSGSIPFQAWAQIKKPYRELVNLLLNLPIHVILCGRQGIDYSEDEQTGELKAIGKRMKAEGETPYEPHVLIRMEAVKERDNRSCITAWVEKDRTGVLMGQTIVYPDFDSLARPLLPLLGLEQGRIESEEDTALRDAEAMARQERERADQSRRLLEEFSAKLALARNVREIEKVNTTITPELKKQMLAADVAALREKYLEASQRARAG